mmetsp:Transcript_7833/g.11825  ORF Transcript_7833/g.11825 Transcript_7833/m.11825 type:complete len:167 (+) Transcript_7833:42-542(+)
MPSCNFHLISLVSIALFVTFMLLKIPMNVNNYMLGSSREYTSNLSNHLLANRKGGFNNLAMSAFVPVGHQTSGVKKQVLISQGQVPHLTNFSRAVLMPGQKVSVHRHKDKDEIFYVASGKGVFSLNDDEREIVAGTSIHVVANEDHKIENDSDEDLVLIYFGIDLK